ncbi:uncharacterized protein LOC142977098 [Anticarsia gemmatalis]|uniref:uncharacterized protein LOC142977098 n=1 Tax=Anticarsia gemmatalis TaxID=129554 RepID=UPI003F767229
MGVPMVNSCCFCATLHTGTLIIGYLYSVWALLELAVYCLLVTLAPLGKNGTVSTHKLALFIVAAVVSGTHLISSVLLVVAAYKKMPSLTLPWTIVTGIITCLFFLMSFTGLSLILQDEGEMLEVEIAIVSMYFARACISVYCIAVVHSRHKQIMYDEDERRFQHSGRLYAGVKTDDHAI